MVRAWLMVRNSLQGKHRPQPRLPFRPCYLPLQGLGEGRLCMDMGFLCVCGCCGGRGEGRVL